MQMSSAVLPHGQSSKMHSARMYVTASTPRNDARATGSSNVAIPTYMEDSPSHAHHPEAAAPVASGNAVEASPDAGDSGEIDAILCTLHRHLQGSQNTANSHDNLKGSLADVADLYEQMRARAGTVLDDELPYEAKPSPDRRLRTRAGAVNVSEVDRDEQRGAGRRSWLDSCRLADRRIAPPESVASHSLESSTSAEIAIEEDGLVLVAHVIDSEPPATSWSLGFVVETTSGTKHIVSCSHTLESAAHTLRSLALPSTNRSASSSTLIISRSGQVFPVSSIASALPLSDILLYNLGEAGAGTADTTKSLHSVPVSLYPPQISTQQSLFTIAQGTAATEQRPGDSVEGWKTTTVVGYKDVRGHDAEPGTYDELNSISIDLLPTPGSSGGPLVSASGAVTGLVRGSRMAFGDRRRTGFATPAEKIFEMFQLPGLGKKLRRNKGA